MPEKFQAERVLPALKALNRTQVEYLKALGSSELVVAIGAPGTGKTYMPTVLASDLYRAGQIKKIIIIRPNEPMGRTLGFRPGDLQEKLAEFVAPVIETIKQRLGVGVLETAIKAGNVECVPLESIRGRTFDNAYIILDEAQNTTPEIMKAVLSRIGKNTSIVVCGDIEQCDLKGEDGLSALVSIIRDQRLDFPIIEFSDADIVRSDLCKTFIRAFRRAGI